MIITRARIEDAREILELQKLAYQSEALLYQDEALPPLLQTLEELDRDFENQFFLKAVLDDRIIGSVRATMKQGTCYIGRLVVHPDYQNRGIGTMLMQVIEQCFARAGRYELFTGHRSERNLELYHKLGYQPYRSEPVHEGLDLVFLEKWIPDRPADPAPRSPRAERR
jgi:GNAT superfamily N-acetyltransferase